ncbi:MAG: glycogen debranching N-terminal domain-containing protein, partial [Gammaproteobacteria bacterium]
GLGRHSPTPTASATPQAEADRLAALVEERFWWEEEGTYYLGLDAHKQPIETVASNAVAPERARRVAERLLAEDMWSGWGVRTLSKKHPAFHA